MAAPHCQVSAIPDRLQWRYEPLALEVVCADLVLETVRQEAVEALNRLSHGGLETGGILFGRRTDRSIEIVGVLPIECEHRLGPSFILSPADEASLQAALTSDKLGTLHPVGLYISHSRRGFSVTETDVRVLNRYFPYPWQIALILVPAKRGPTRAGFFVRNQDGAPAFACAYEVSLSARERRREAPVSESRAVVTRAFSRIRPERDAVIIETTAVGTTPIRTAVAEVPANPNPVDSQATALQRLHSFLAQEHRRWRTSQWNLAATLALTKTQVFVTGAFSKLRSKRDAVLGETRAVNTTPILTAVAQVTENPKPVSSQVTALQRLHFFLAHEHRHWRPSQWNLAATLALLLLCVSAGGLWLRGRAAPSPAVPMRVADLGSNLRIEWDPAKKAVRSASGAKLEIRDGKREPVAIPITRSGLDSGSVLYVPQSDSIEVRLKLMQGNRTSSESVIYFINSSRATAPRATASATTVPGATAPASSRQVSPPTPETQPEQPPLRRSEKQAAAEPQRPQKAFRLPARRGTNAAGQRGFINLPDLPDIHANQSSVPMLPLANGSSLMAHLLASPPRPVSQPRLPSGHLIWTGALRKNAVLSISPEGASSGVLNGRLPGAPVKISLQPAELVDGGIAVYSRDRERLGATEPSSAWNGWNVVFYDWDPKRITEVSIAEPPGPANNWKRLVLRNGNRNVSVVVVDWQRVGK